MEKPYFVMLYNQKGTRFIPLTSPADQLEMFATPEQARDAAEGSLFGSRFGYEIFEAGDGVFVANDR